MAKRPKYTPEEIALIASSLKAGMSDEQIGVRLGRSTTGITVCIVRNKIPRLCVICKSIKSIGNKKYCTVCAKKKKQDDGSKRYEQNKSWYKNHRYELHRFGNNYKNTLIRDNYTCVSCGMKNQEHIDKRGCEITVDHIDGKGRSSEYKNNDISNLQTLCLHCHGAKDAKRTKHYKEAHGII